MEREAITKITDQAHDFPPCKRTATISGSGSSGAIKKSSCYEALKKLLKSKLKPKTCIAYNDHVGVLLAQSSLSQHLNAVLDEDWDITNDRIKITVEDDEDVVESIQEIPIGPKGFLSAGKAKKIVSGDEGVLDMIEVMADGKWDKPITVTLRFPVDVDGNDYAAEKTKIHEKIIKMKKIDKKGVTGHYSIIDCSPPPKPAWKLNLDRKYWLSKQLDPLSSKDGGAKGVNANINGSITVPFIAYKVDGEAGIIYLTVNVDDKNIKMKFSGAGMGTVNLGNKELPSGCTLIYAYLSSIINIGRDGKTTAGGRNRNILNFIPSVFKAGWKKIKGKTQIDEKILNKFTKIASKMAIKIWPAIKIEPKKTQNEEARLKFIIAFILNLKTFGDYTNLLDAWKLGTTKNESLLWTCDNFLKFVALFFEPPGSKRNNFNIKYYKEDFAGKSHRIWTPNFYNMRGGAPADGGAGNQNEENVNHDELLRNAMKWALSDDRGVLARGQDVAGWMDTLSDNQLSELIFNNFTPELLADEEQPRSGRGGGWRMWPQLVGGESWKERLDTLLRWRKNEIKKLTREEVLSGSFGDDADDIIDYLDIEFIWRIEAEMAWIIDIVKKAAFDDSVNIPNARRWAEVAANIFWNADIPSHNEQKNFMNNFNKILTNELEVYQVIYYLFGRSDRSYINGLNVDQLRDIFHELVKKRVTLLDGIGKWYVAYNVDGRVYYQYRQGDAHSRSWTKPEELELEEAEAPYRPPPVPPPVKTSPAAAHSVRPPQSMEENTESTSRKRSSTRVSRRQSATR